MNSLATPDELHVIKLRKHATDSYIRKTKPTFRHCKKYQEITEFSCKNNKLKARKRLLEILTVAQMTLTPTRTKLTKTLKLSVYLQEHKERQTSSLRNATMEPMEQTGHFLGRTSRRDRKNFNNRTHRII